MENLVNFVESQFIKKKDFPQISSGDTVTVYYDIREGDKVRTQFFKGVIFHQISYLSDFTDQEFRDIVHMAHGWVVQRIDFSG